MIAYFRMLYYLIGIFIVFSILSIPSIVIYSSYDGLAELSNYSKSKYTLGNMGYSGATCSSMYLGVGKEQTISCDNGKITKLYSYGLIPSNFEGRKDFCGEAS